MSWEGVSPELRAIIEEVCTPKQIEALKLKSAGMSTRGIAMVLGIDHKTAADRLNRAYRRVQARVPNRDALS